MSSRPPSATWGIAKLREKSSPPAGGLSGDSVCTGGIRKCGRGVNHEGWTQEWLAFPI